MLFVGGVVLAVAAALGAWVAVNMQPVDSSNGEFVEVEVPVGASIQQVASILTAKDLIRSDLVFVLLAKLSSARIEAGTHEISPSMSTADIIHRLNSASKSTFQITILPEMTMLDIKDLFIKYDFSSAEVNTALTKTYNHPLLASKPSELDLEGYIFPDTYEMRKQDNLETLLEMTFDNLYDRLETDGSLALINSKDLTIHQALTLSSIVGKEAPEDQDQKIIAGVFWNRLNIDMPLGSDVTFKYAYKMGYCGVDSPDCASAWNTRIHAGLPPGPISNMKYSTLQATLNPTASEFYYFVAGDDGIIHYATTEDQHHANVYQYCSVQCQ
ncbi:MAG: endolytic transglycosylase MltG [Candidatus Nomurabacteria bacterium]|jgi:UPF0755 protein|nr:endolytic transglycosylase MltG [Candidatus Nomurabacteria bacterium]